MPNLGSALYLESHPSQEVKTNEISIWYLLTWGYFLEISRACTVADYKKQ